MGTCFRWKKKNSYTVTQIDEYTPSRGKYNVNGENVPTTKASRQATHNAASQWANESKSDVTKRNIPPSKNLVVATENHDVRSNDVTNGDQSVIKENGFHSEKRRSPSPPSSPPSSPESERSPVRIEPEVLRIDSDAVEHRHQEDNDRVSLELAANAIVVDEVHSSSERLDDNFTADVQNNTPTNTATDDFTTRISSGSDASDDLEDLVKVREEYLAEKSFEKGYDVREEYLTENSPEEGHDERQEYERQEYSMEEPQKTSDESYDIHTTSIITETITQEIRSQPEGRFDDERDILNSREDIHITDSPAGTWDARLNKDVRAELDEMQHSPEGSSKTNSTVSLETRDVREQDDVIVKPPRDPMVIQRVQFDVPDTDEDEDCGDDVTTGVSVTSISNDIYEGDQSEDPFQITSYQTYHSEHVVREAEELDNDVNDRLAVIGENEYEFAGERDGGVGEIVLSDEYAVSYEEPSSPRRLSGGYSTNDSY